MNADSNLTPLDPRFPIRLSMPESIFWDAVHLEPYRPCIEALAWRARAQAAYHQERFVTPQPRFVPEQAHDDTVTDMAPVDDDTSTRIQAIDDIWEQYTVPRTETQRPRLRRAAGRLLSITRGNDDEWLA